jgi:hypothetical protein
MVLGWFFDFKNNGFGRYLHGDQNPHFEYGLYAVEQ